jgi:hypothetical protein
MSNYARYRSKITFGQDDSQKNGLGNCIPLIKDSGHKKRPLLSMTYCED